LRREAALHDLPARSTPGMLSGPMTKTEHPDRLVLHIAGADRTGVTARLTEIIAQEGAALINIGQSVLNGYLMLSAIVDIPKNSYALRKILFAAADMGLRLEVTPFKLAPEATELPESPALAVTLLGPLSNGLATAQITRFMAERSMNIREIRSLSDVQLNGLELIADLPPGKELRPPEMATLRGEFLRMGMELGVDLAVQKDDIFRRTKRLVCMDVDSTFVKGEFIDELAELVGVKEQVAAITARAMKGEIDFKGALQERVKLLAGLPFERAQSLIDRFELTPGADSWVKKLQSLGFKIGLVSGGFTFFVDVLKQRFGLDFAFANELEVEGGKLTGRVRGAIVDSERKAQVLKDMAQVYSCRLEQSVAIGDGANDILMLQTAGLGIAFRAKPKLQEVASMSLNHHERLDTLLYLMGWNERDLRTV
jgi:phosphoserine phosphatase